MRWISGFSALMALAALTSGCLDDTLVPAGSEQAVVVPAVDTNAERIAEAVVSLAGWPRDDAATVLPAAPPGLEPGIADLQRQVIAGDIVHYSVRVQVGPGPHDFIGIHRVVREKRPYQPIKTHHNIFLQHGCCKDFIGMYLPGLYSPTTADDFGFAVYLARQGIDVWGIDQSWTLVPKEVTDFAFMADWGLAHQMGDLRTAVTIARTARLLTGNGHGKMLLSGYSNGVISSLAVVNEETQLPPGHRQVGGYVPIDVPIKTDHEGLRQAMIGYVEGYYRPFYEAGQYQDVSIFPDMAALVRCCPDAPSPFNPAVTNMQFALLASASPGFGPDTGTMHYWAGVFDDAGMPTAIRFTPYELWLDFLASGVPYEPMLWGLDWMSYSAGISDTPYDDHLSEIEVPILNVTPAGGFAEQTLYGLSLLGSKDKQTLMPSMGLPPAEDYAHIDLFTYAGSEQLFWAPFAGWIKSHTNGPAGLAPELADR